MSLPKNEITEKQRIIKIHEHRETLLEGTVNDQRGGKLIQGTKSQRTQEKGKEKGERVCLGRQRCYK